MCHTPLSGLLFTRDGPLRIECFMGPQPNINAAARDEHESVHWLLRRRGGNVRRDEAMRELRLSSCLLGEKP